jgi:uncharacterized repeat protein (TIGR01451 family)
MKHHYLITGTLILLVIGVVYCTPAQAAPHTVTYKSTRVTTAVPGKPFNLNLQVKNTSNDNYSNVQITFHVPSGMQHSSVSPANAIVQDDTITWYNVPMNANQTFNPSFTFTIDSGTPLNTKFNLWAEVTGDGMESTSTNFSITTRKTSSPASSLSSNDIKSMFQSVYGRTPTASELTYWLGRRTDKPQRTPLLGAIAYHHALNIKH